MGWFGPAGDCGCCDGTVTCPCDCYDPDDPDCSQQNESAVDAPSITISGVTNTYQVTHFFSQDYSGIVRSSGSFCDCYRAFREYNTDFQVTGLSGLNGTYPAITQNAPALSSIVGPCTSPTTPTGHPDADCGVCTESCEQVIWIKEVSVTATLRVWWSDTVTEEPSNAFCPDPPADESSDVTTNYTGYAFVTGLKVTAGDQGYPSTVLEPKITVWLWATGATNPSIKIDFGFNCSSAVSDPGDTCVGTPPGETWRGFGSCGESYYLGLGEPTSVISSAISCHPRWHRAVDAPEFSCYTGSDHPTIGNISCAANSYSGSRTVLDIGGCTGFISDPNDYLEYSYDTTAFSANFSLSM